MTDISVVGLEEGTKGLTFDSDGLSSLPESVLVLSDVASSSYIYNGYEPILRILPAGSELSTSLFQSYYISLNSSRFNRIRIYLRNSEGGQLDLDKWKGRDICLKCTLHFHN